MSDLYKSVPSAQVTAAEQKYIKSAAEMTCARFGTLQPIFVNIGVMWGNTMHCLRAGCEPAALYGVDCDFAMYPVYYREELNATMLEGDSRVLWQDFKDDIHLLLIDGDHHYETVVADIAGWTPKVVQGGLVIFHDYAPSELNLQQFPHLKGVKQAVNEWANRDWQQLDALDSLAVFWRLQ